MEKEERSKKGLAQGTIADKILIIRGQKVMLDRDLADLYHVDTSLLKRQVRRNIERFPEDFMFVLSIEEVEILRCQIGTSRWGGTRYLPMAFTEQGVSMLSSVLKSPIAIQVNIQIMRFFTQMREMLFTQKELLLKMEEMEKRFAGQDQKIKIIFDYLKQFIKEQEKPRRQVGFNR